MNTETKLKAGAREVTTIRGVEVAWRLVPAGSYTMGSPLTDVERYDDEEQRLVTIHEPFWLAETPVTQALSGAVTGTNPSYFTGNTRRPVERVSWDEASAFAERVGCRLPTEEEWEYACRAGTTTARYGALDEIAWHAGNSRGSTRPVGTREPNAWGLRDMLGNVWEWTSTAQGSNRVYRGGSWCLHARLVRAASRDARTPGLRVDDLGFRLARGLAPSRQAKPSASPPECRAEPARDAGDDWRVW